MFVNLNTNLSIFLSFDVCIINIVLLKYFHNLKMVMTILGCYHLDYILYNHQYPKIFVRIFRLEYIYNPSVVRYDIRKKFFISILRLENIYNPSVVRFDIIACKPSPKEIKGGLFY